MTIAFLNGEYMPLSEAKISPMDRGFLFGDGIYEVIPTYSGSAVGFKGHTSRMAQGLKAIEIANPYSAEEWQDILTSLVEKKQSIYRKRKHWCLFPRKSWHRYKTFSCIP